MLRQVVDHVLYNPQGYMEIYLRPQTKLIHKDLVFYLNREDYLPLFVHIPSAQILYVDTSRVQSIKQYLRTHRLSYPQAKLLLEECGSLMRDLGQVICFYHLEDVFIDASELRVRLVCLPVEVPSFSVNIAFQKFVTELLETADLNISYEIISQWYMLLKSQSFTIDFFLNTLKNEGKSVFHLFSFFKARKSKQPDVTTFYDCFASSSQLQEESTSYLAGQATTELGNGEKTQLLINFGYLENSQGEKFVLHGDFHVGRDQDNDLILSDKSISRHHARIYMGQQGLCLEDLASTNGTWLNEDKNRLDHAYILKNDDRIRFGQVVMVYHEST